MADPTTPTGPRDPVLLPVHAIGLGLRPIESPTKPGLYDLVEIDGQMFMRVWPPGDPYAEGRDPFGRLMRQAKLCATALSITTFSHVWIEPVILDADRRVLWREPKVLSLVVDKEIDAGGPIPMEMPDYLFSKQVSGWIAAQYPQVIVFNYTGLFLLRSSLGYDYADYFHAEALVAFFKIAEAVTARRTGDLSPDLGVIQKVAAELETHFDDREIRDLYVLRGDAGAHGGRLALVSRRQAVEAKLFADSMVMKDYIDRRGGPIDVGGPLPHHRVRGSRRRGRSAE